MSSIIDNYLSDSDDGLAVHANPELDGFVSQPSSATEIYRNAMDMMGSASRHGVNFSQPVTQANKSDNDRCALVNEDNCINDDWLIDDMQPSKRRRVDVNGVFSTSNTRRSGERRCSKEETNRQDRVNGIQDREVIESSNKERTCDKRQERSECSGLGSDNDLLVDMFEEDFITIDDSTPDSGRHLSTGVNQRLNKANYRKKQLKITHFNTQRTQQSQRHSGSTSTVLNPSQTLHLANNTQLPVLPPQQTNQISNLTVMRIKVKVKDKLLLIPVTNR